MVDIVTALDSVGGLRAPRLGQVATRCAIPHTFLSANKQLMSRSVHTLRDDVTSIQLAFANWHCQQPTSTEQSSGGVITLTVGVEYPIGATPIRVTFSGANSVNIPELTTVLSDALPMVAKRGERFAVKTYQTNTAGIIFSEARDASAGSFLEGFVAGVSGVVDNTITTTNPTASSLAYVPCAIVAQTSRPSVWLAGDSKVVGGTEPADKFDPGGLTGEFERSVGKKVAFINGASSGDKAQIASGSYSRRAALAQYCTHVLSNFGINDVVGAQTAAQVLADLQTLRSAIGLPFWQTTVAPYTTSTDSWATTTNQTVWSVAGNTQRVALNDLIRNVPANFAGMFDICEAVESDRNTGLWKPGLTSDGLHENAAGYLAIERSLLINPEVFFRVPALD